MKPPGFLSRRQVVMEPTNEIKQAAQALGQALKNDPVVQAFVQADAAVKNSEEVTRLEAGVYTLYNDLTSRQQAGEILSPQEINRFYNLRDQLARHPLVVERDASMKAAKAIFEQTGSILSSILTMDYTALVLEEN